MRLDRSNIAAVSHRNEYCRSSLKKRTTSISMFNSTILLAMSLLGGAAAQGGGINQCETARLTQAAQRAEFGVEGDTSAFKFKFSDPVCSAVWIQLRGAYNLRCGHLAIEAFYLFCCVTPVTQIKKSVSSSIKHVERLGEASMTAVWRSLPY